MDAELKAILNNVQLLQTALKDAQQKMEDPKLQRALKDVQDPVQQKDVHEGVRQAYEAGDQVKKKIVLPVLRDMFDAVKRLQDAVQKVMTDTALQKALNDVQREDDAQD